MTAADNTDTKIALFTDSKILTNLHAVGHGRGVELDETQGRGPTVGEVTEDDAGVFGVTYVAEGGLGLLLLAAEVPNSDVRVCRLRDHDGNTE